MKSNALRINDNDNVAIAAEVIRQGEPVVVNGELLCKTTEDIEPGHKVALFSIANKERVFRYGEPIVQAIRDISQGEWVHVHNTRPVPGDLQE